MTNASRAPIDFDAFERELRQSQPQAHPQPGATSDPLAELARIVGQDDPFRALLEARGAGDRPAARIEPSFQHAPPEAAPAAHPHASHAAGAEPSAADAFDQYLASVEQGGYADEPHDPAAFADDAAGFRPLPLERPRMRGRLVQVGAGLGVLALCVTGALTWRGLHGHGANGEPVTVLADKTPLKVAPTAADGVEIPDQNKQIYERKAKDGQIKVVNREEQPLDVAQAARSAAPTASGQGNSSQGNSGQGNSGQGGTTPGQTGLLSESLGEPRRVRTVTVKPDTPPPAAQREASADPAGSGMPAPIPTMTMPDASAPAPTASRRPSRTLASTPAPVRTAEAEAAEAPIPTPSPAPAPRVKATQRVAAVAPETTASTLEAPAAAPAAAPSAVAGGGYAVQLGVRTSESEARTAFRQMQGKYAELAGKPELIRQAEVNGKSIYRVRVGPLAKADATSLCTTLQGAGGQCFVAKN